MKKIYVLMGKSLSGKTYAQNKLSELNLAKPLKTSTTRPMRNENETGYYFVTDAEYYKDAAEFNVLALRKYKVATGDTWYYYLNTKELNKYDVASIILDYKGFKEFKNHANAYVSDYIKIIGIYLDIPIKERIMRHYGSERKTENDREFVRRLYDDEFNAFNGIKNDNSVISCTSTEDVIKTIRKLNQ